MAITGLGQAMASLMQQFGSGGQTAVGAAPSAYQVNADAASVPQWSPAIGMGGNAPMAGPQSVPGQTAQPGPIMQALSKPQSYGQSQQGSSMARQGVDALLAAGMTAAMAPVMGPLAPVVGPMLGQAASSFLIPHKGGRQQPPGGPQEPQQTPFTPIQDPSAGGNDQYAALLQMLQQQR